MDGDIAMLDRITQGAALSVVRLCDAAKGDRGVVLHVTAEPGPAGGGVDELELERRLLEIGFVEGAHVEVLHEGFIGRDPIAVKLDDMRVALRRREARGILLKLEAKAGPSGKPRG